MITSIHTLIYSDDANATRAFLRDLVIIAAAYDVLFPRKHNQRIEALSDYLRQSAGN